MNERTETLVLKTLAGEASPAEQAELEARLATEPDARAYRDELLREDALLRGHERTGLAAIDWSRVKRVRGLLSFHRIATVTGLLGLLALMAKSALEAESVWDAIGSTLWALVAAWWAFEAVIDRSRTRRLLAWMNDGEGDLLERYRIVLRRESRRAATGLLGYSPGIVMLLLLAVFGKYPAQCLIAAGIVALIGLYQDVFVRRPLRRELRELDPC